MALGFQPMAGEVPVHRQFSVMAATILNSTWFQFAEEDQRHIITDVLSWDDEFKKREEERAMRLGIEHEAEFAFAWQERQRILADRAKAAAETAEAAQADREAASP